MKNYWRTTDFWGKVKASLGVLASTTTAGMAGADALKILQISSAWIAVSASAALLIYALDIWFTDLDKDGVVDILEK